MFIFDPNCLLFMIFCIIMNVGVCMYNKSTYRFEVRNTVLTHYEVKLSPIFNDMNI
jgi:hypothetical protein